MNKKSESKSQHEDQIRMILWFESNKCCRFIKEYEEINGVELKYSQVARAMQIALDSKDYDDFESKFKGD